MAHPPELHVQLRAAYVGGLPLEQAAAHVGVPFGTARNWFREAKARGDDWDRFQRVCLLVAGGSIEQAMGRIISAGLLRCEALLERLTEIEDPVAATTACASLGDVISKLRAAGKQFMPETSESTQATELLRALAQWCGAKAPAQGMVLAAVLEGFAAQRKLSLAAALEDLRALARAAGAGDSDKPAGLSDDSAESIRAKILGV